MLRVLAEQFLAREGDCAVPDDSTTPHDVLPNTISQSARAGFGAQPHVGTARTSGPARQQSGASPPPERRAGVWGRAPPTKVPPQRDDKPNSVPGPAPESAEPDDDHSSSPAITGGIQRPTRRLRTGRPMTPPYLVLLRAGFSLPSALRRTRCALTAPFHPYPSTRRAEARLAQGWPEGLPRASSRGGMFSVPLSFRSP